MQFECSPVAVLATWVLVMRPVLFVQREHSDEDTRCGRGQSRRSDLLVRVIAGRMLCLYPAQ